MKSTSFTYWHADSHWVGYLDEHPEYMTQGESMKDLKEHLTDLYKELNSEEITHARDHAELELT